MKKLFMKKKKPVTHKKASHPEHVEEVEVDADGVEELMPDSFHEAFDILSRLAQSTPAHMGTAHGIQLIHDAQKWVAAHVVADEA